MNLNTLKSSHKVKRSQRIGRSGKRGSYSGRGVKGQKSRAGRRIRPAFRDLILRIPKRRGFRNKPKSAPPAVFNLSDLDRALRPLLGGAKFLEAGKASLVQSGLLPDGFRGKVKVLGGGEISFALRAEGLGFSSAARAKVERAGGKVEQKPRVKIQKAKAES